MVDDVVQAEASAHGDPDAARSRVRLFRALAVALALGLGGVLFLALGVYDGARSMYFEGAPGSGLKLLYDAQLGWRNIPDDDTVTYGKPMTTNAHGMRGPETPREKPPGTKRILLLGDSFAWGFSVADDEVVSHAMQKQLDPGRTQWEVLNAAVSGWGTDQEYLYLLAEGFDFEPDIVVLTVFLANDHDGNASSRMYGRDKPVFLDVDLELANVPVPKPGGESPVIRTRADPVELTATIVNRMAAECGRRGCAFVPTWFGGYMAPRYEAAENEIYAQAARKFVSLLEQGDHIRPLDLDAAFAAVGATYDTLTEGGADRHWNATGHRIAAERILRHLRRNGLLE